MTLSAAGHVDWLTALNLGHQVPWESALVFMAASLALSFFDIPLPRGDFVVVGATLDVVALAVLGPVPAVLCSLTGVLAGLVPRRSGIRARNAVFALVSRLSGLVAALAIYAVVPELTGAALWMRQALAVAAYILVEFLSVQLAAAARTGRRFLGLLEGNAHRLAPLMLAQLSTALLAIMVYGHMGAWSLVLVIALLLLIRQSYALLLEISETYLQTIGVIVQAAEGVDSEREGHAERTAQIAREIAAACGLSSRQVERLSYAALLHDIDTLSHGGQDRAARRSASAILEGIPFFEDVVRILSVFDERARKDVDPEELLSAFIVALASEIDAVEHRDAHGGEAQVTLASVSPLVPQYLKAKAVSAAIRMGHSVPAVT